MNEKLISHSLYLANHQSPLHMSGIYNKKHVLVYRDAEC